MKCRRGEIWLADLEPVMGHEQGGYRPVLVLSSNRLNDSPAEMVIILPITSKKRNLPTHIEVNADYFSQVSYIKVEDIRAISKKRLNKKIGSVSNEVLSEIEVILKLLLDFE